MIGAVGQPRDRNPAACYALYDDGPRTLTYVRVPYDVETAARKIRDAGLPSFLAARLASGGEALQKNKRGDPFGSPHIA